MVMTAIIEPVVLGQPGLIPSYIWRHPLMSFRTRRFGLEQLEDRCTPALTFAFDGLGDLTVSGFTSTGTLDVTATAANTFTFDDGVNTIMANAIVPKNLTINLGSEADMVNFDLAGNSMSGSLSIDSGGGGDTVSLGSGAGGSIAGNLSLSRTGSSVSVVNMSIGGNVTDNNTTGSATTGLTLTACTVGGSLTYNGGTTADQVTLGTSLIGGNVTANLGNGLNLFDFSSAAGVIGGNVSVTSGTGSATGATANLAGIIGGSVTLNFGFGGGGQTNAVTFTGTIGGNFTYLGGNGADHLDTFSGLIGGSANFNLGSGSTTSVSAGNTLNFTGTVGGGSFTYTGGIGIDNVTFAGHAGRAAVNVNLGGGTGTFVLGSSATTSLASLYLDFGTSGTGITHTFTNNYGAAFYFPVTIKNL
jgi:hypothetical protein